MSTPSGAVSGLQVGDTRGRGDVKGVVDAALVIGQLGGLGDGAGVADEDDFVDAAQLGGDAPPRGAGGAFGDADEVQRQPAQQHVGVDAVGQVVEHRPQLEHGLEIAEAASDVLARLADLTAGERGGRRGARSRPHGETAT